MIKNLYRFLNPGYQKVYLEQRVNLVPRYGHGNPPHGRLYDIVSSGRHVYRKSIQRIIEHKAELWNIRDSGAETNKDEPSWNNGFLPGLDIMSLYSIISDYKPSRYIEIGSGNSTKVANRAKRDNCQGLEIISVDPSPRAEIGDVTDKIFRENLENTNLNIPEMLNEGDILFIDGSHRMHPNSDTMVFFMEILPRLRKGVIVQLHDIYIPYDYPQFMCDRFYSEQYCLAIWLLANPERSEIILPNYFISQDDELSGLLSPVWDNKNLNNVERHGGSFWFRIAG